MAVIIFSPIISSARGKVADCVFSVWKGIPYIRQRVIPANPQSADQTAVRTSLARCVSLWQSLEAQIKAVQNTYATAYQMSGFNNFMKDNRANEQSALGIQITPPNAALDPVTTFTPVSGVASGSISADWTGGSGHASCYIYVAHRKTGLDAFTVFSKDTVLASAGTLEITGLVSLSSYEIVIAVEACSTSTFSISKTAEATPS